MSIGFIGAATYGLANGNGGAGAAIFLLSIGAVFFVMGWRQLTNKTPHIQFGPSGIWTPKSGHLPWNRITLKIGSVYTGKAGRVGTIYILERQTKRHLEGVVTSGLDHSSSYIENALRSYKKADITNC